MIAIICFTEKGKVLADNVAKKLRTTGHKCSVTSAKQGSSKNCSNTDEWVFENFKKDNYLLFIGACGIAVRKIARFVKDKTSDPAVIVMDECAQFVIPILSGHLGGANAFANELAKVTGAKAVITTATDVNNLFSVDSFAKKNSMKISDMTLSKKFSAELLKKRRCNLFFSEKIFDCIKISDSVPQEINLSPICKNDSEIPTTIISPFKNEFNSKVLTLLPKCLVLGIGLRKGKSKKELTDFILRELESFSVDVNSIAYVCSIDLKKDENALVSFCKDFSLPLKVFSAQELISAKGNFSASSFVKEVTGVDNVCERSIIASGGKKIIVQKIKSNGMTLALGCFEIPIHFD